MAASNLDPLVMPPAPPPAAPPPGAATPPAQQLPITLDAQSVEGGLGNMNQVFHKVHIAQGPMSIDAELGQASSLDFDNSLWTFRGNVKITMNQGQLLSDEARITFIDKHLRKALVEGKPATFEQRVQKTGKLAQGKAAAIDYDAASGIVHLTDNAWVSDGQNEIRGESLKYNVIAQSIVAESSEQNSQRVHIVITPPPPQPASAAPKP